MSEKKLVLRDLSKTYLGEIPSEILKKINLSIVMGETVSILGPSGSGKSTLLNIIGSLTKPSEGSVFWGEQEIPLLEGKALAKYRSREVGFVFQEHHLLPQLTALENTLLPTLVQKQKSQIKRGQDLLDQLGLSQKMNSFPWQMSGGERQRVAIARAMINEAKILLCDEPTGNLDPKTGESIVDIFLNLAQKNQAIVIMVTHNERLAQKLQRIFILSEGSLEPKKFS